MWVIKKLQNKVSVLFFSPFYHKSSIFKGRLYILLPNLHISLRNLSSKTQLLYKRDLFL